METATGPSGAPPAGPVEEQEPPKAKTIVTIGSLARAGPDAVADHVGLQLRLPHLAEQRQSQLPMAALTARAAHGAIAGDVGLHCRLPHLSEQRQAALPVLDLLARPDPTIVAR
ncbi:unnamed protein product [Prorocentrum cordatum]|uniref:Uncharacterized protein n=1 Tax=Prorocentrum cordatum TaxID=2364126 RepID=A0ABN9T8W1_9DINO|nr:unnamed protein product [Polarella glacialis]